MKLDALTKSCQLINDRVRYRFPITNGLLEAILSKIEERFVAQFYLELLYKALFTLGHYGMMRIGELTIGSAHTLRAKDLFVARHKSKFRAILRSSKTHGKGSRPQKIKVQGNVHLDQERGAAKRKYCPFTCINQFLQIRGDYENEKEPLFIFKDGSAVKPIHVRRLLKSILTELNLDKELYDTHSLRIGRATDLMKYGYNIEQIKQLGRWKSNAVYKYLKL